MKLLKDCFTGVDNETYDLGRVLGGIALLSYFTFPYISHQSINLLEWAGGGASLFTSIGAFLWLKKDTEPKK